MNTKSKASVAILYAGLSVFVLFVAYILYINQEVFYTAHDRSEFVYGTPFFNALISKPFGLMRYVGAWLTQLFCIPALGSCVLALIWFLIYLIGSKAFRLHDNASALMLLPVACLLTSVVDTGYWIYISTIRGYWFSQSVGYLVMLVLLWAAYHTPRKWHFIWYLLAFLLYPILGWFALLFVICLVVAEKPTWRELFGIVVIFFTARLWRTLLYSNLNYEDVNLAGLPIFITPSDYSEYLTTPFWLLGAISVIIPLCARYLSKSYVPILCVALGIIFTCSLKFEDKNYTDEMRMVRHAENDNWQEILDIADRSSNPTTTMVMLKNVALMNKGGLLDCSFKMGNNGASLYNPDSLRVSMLEIAAPVVYYNYGLINESIRLNFECAIQSGFSPFYLKSLSRCALACGDEKLLERYLDIIHQLPFYGDWQPLPVTPIVNELKISYSDELTGVENSDSYLVNTISQWYESDNKVASEQALFYSMLRCDSRRFWESLRKFIKLHQGENFPVHAQEAYLLFVDKKPETKRMILPVEDTVYNRYKQFWTVLENYVKNGHSREETQEKMLNDWGDTYWYYNIFGRKIY